MDFLQVERSLFHPDSTVLFYESARALVAEVYSDQVALLRVCSRQMKELEKTMIKLLKLVGK